MVYLVNLLHTQPDWRKAFVSGAALTLTHWMLILPAVAILAPHSLRDATSELLHWRTLGSVLFTPLWETFALFLLVVVVRERFAHPWQIGLSASLGFGLLHALSKGPVSGLWAAWGFFVMTLLLLRAPSKNTLLVAFTSVVVIHGLNNAFAIVGNSVKRSLGM